MPLDKRPARKNLTSREIAKILGGLLGALLGMAALEDLQNAVGWWHDTPEAWQGLKKAQQIVEDEAFIQSFLDQEVP